MSDINIVLDTQCTCPAGKCAAMFGEDDRGGCVNRLSGDVRVVHCESCGAGTWHKDGRCLKCKEKS